MSESTEENGNSVLQEIEHGLGEVHNSLAPLELSLGIALTLAGLLVWPFLIIGLIITIHAIFSWVKEDLGLWEHREALEKGEWGHASWAMVWIIVTEVIVFASFFAFWFWAKWHTVSWENAVGGSWPAVGVEHDMTLVTVNTLILLTSGFTSHKALHALKEGDSHKSGVLIKVTVLLGLVFLGIQIYEYSSAGFLWTDHSYGTAFFALTGLHGLHVLVGVICLLVANYLITKEYYTELKHDSYQAITWYWHFVDVVWVLLYLVVYVEVV
ncbi:MAG: cytochrome c oxidase subunit 3 [Candidatus Thalassarchaeaceae archaeon]|nr:cytochrome c oxidase subunit 3 [Candidatus Thalassarchaeaceae archaeon]MDP7043758.1 cytochrome c oxidase subunit 3 [Candidatus Thalassarchaeaceae archaeon]